MRSPLVGCSLVIAVVSIWASASLAQEDLGSNVPAKLLRASADHRSAAARTSAVGDTTYLGFVPGKVSATNYWGIGVGAYHPYSTNPADYGYWSFDNDAIHDNIAECHGDSLFGWWPLRTLMNGTGSRL